MDMGSMDNRSIDPDHEPRKEGTHKMKHSPSITEILPTQPHDGNSENASIAKGNRGSQSRSPGRVVAGVTDIDDGSDNNFRNINSGHKGERNSGRKIKPI